MADLNASLRKLDDIDAKLAGEKLFTRETFEAHVEAEIAKAETDAPDVAKARLAKLREQIATARKAFESNDTFRTAVFDGHGQIKPTDAVIDTPPRVPTQGVGFDPAASVAKGEALRSSLAKAAETDPKKAEELVGRSARAIAKALEKDEALRAEVVKAAETAPEALRVGVAKGMAGTMLSQVAAMFGFDPTDDDDMCGIGWKVGDVIRDLERAASLETAMSRMQAVLGGTYKAGEGDPDPKAPTPKTPTAKEFVFPTDLSSAIVDEKGDMKDPVSKWDSVSGEEL